MRKPDIGMFKIINKIWKVDKRKFIYDWRSKTDMQFAKKVELKVFSLRNEIFTNLLKIKFINEKF